MSDRPFIAKLPKKAKHGDEIVIRGKLRDDASVFSINLCLPRPPTVCADETPPYIAYHFKTIFRDDGSSVVIHNWKNHIWQTEVREDNYWMYDRAQRFTLIFRFHNEAIKVFAEDVQHTPDYEFEHQFPFEDITTIELWDDIEFIDEISFKYKNDDNDQ